MNALGVCLHAARRCIETRWKKNTHNIDEIGRDEWKLYKENIVLHTWNRYVSTKKYVGDQEKHRAEQESIEIKGTKLFSC